MYQFSFWFRYQHAFAIEIFVVKWYKFKKDIIIHYQLHAPCMFTRFITDKSFARQVILNVNNWLAQQFFETFFIRFKSYTAMNEKAEIGPYLMNVLYLVVLDHHFHTHLAPCRHANYIADIPFAGVLYYFVEFLVPVTQCRYSAPRFIKRLEPEWSFLC